EPHRGPRRQQRHRSILARRSPAGTAVLHGTARLRPHRGADGRPDHRGGTHHPALPLQGGPTRLRTGRCAGLTTPTPVLGTARTTAGQGDRPVGWAVAGHQPTSQHPGQTRWEGATTARRVADTAPDGTPSGTAGRGLDLATHGTT